MYNYFYNTLTSVLLVIPFLKEKNDTCKKLMPLVKNSMK